MVTLGEGAPLPSITERDRFFENLQKTARRGSSFTARLGVTAEDFDANEVDPSVCAPEPLRAYDRPLRVLLAEDSPANQKLVVYVLTQRGHSVEIAEDGQRALDLHQRHEVDVLLMDVQMPVMDGLQATAAIRALQDQTKARVPIIAMTAHALRGDRDRCLAAGMDDYISKPIDGHELIRLVEQLGAKGDHEDPGRS